MVRESSRDSGPFSLEEGSLGQVLGRTYLRREILETGRWCSCATWMSVAGCHSALETKVPSLGCCSSLNCALESRWSPVPFTSHEPTSPSCPTGSSAKLVYSASPLLQVLALAYPPLSLFQHEALQQSSHSDSSRHSSTSSVQ